MSVNMSRRVRQIAWLLALVYFASYLMRKNFGTMTDAVLLDTGSAKSMLSIVIIGMSVSYGVGQIICGIIGDRVSPVKMITVGLFFAFACNLAMCFCRSIPLMCVVWCLNGVAHSMMWPPMSRILAMMLTSGEYAYATVRVAWGSSFATVFLYLFCSLMLRIMSWRYIIMLCALGGLGITVFWMFQNGRMFRELPSEQPSVPVADGGAPQEGAKLPKYVWGALILMMVAIVLQGSLRDGVSDWMPTFLRESFSLSSENSILVTVAQAALSIASFSIFGTLQQRLIHNEATCAVVIFGGSAVASALLLWCVTAGGSWLAVAASVALMSVLIACMHGVNLLLISFVPRHFVKTGKVSTFSGLLNSCTYVGSAVGSYLFAALAESGDWSPTVISWIVISAAGVVMCVIAAPLWQRFSKDN